VVESTRCPNCTSPILPGQAFCPNCGASLAGMSARLDEEPVQAPEPAFVPEPAPEPAFVPEPAPEPAFVPEPAPERRFEPEPVPDQALLYDPGVSVVNRVPGSYLPPAEELPPSAWTIQPSNSSIIGRRPGSLPNMSVATIPVAAPITVPSPETPVAASKGESATELVAFGLSVAGAALGIASLFLPWTGVSGIGVGTTQAGGTNQWAFAMPAGIPVLVVTALILAGIVGSEKAQLELPKLALVIARVTATILPMILGGLYLGVVLMYVTLPSSFGYGMGIVILLIASLLLVAGSVVSIFFPAEPASKVE